MNTIAAYVLLYSAAFIFIWSLLVTLEPILHQ